MLDIKKEKEKGGRSWFESHMCQQAHAYEWRMHHLIVAYREVLV